MLNNDDFHRRLVRVLAHSLQQHWRFLLYILFFVCRQSSESDRQSIPRGIIRTGDPIAQTFCARYPVTLTSHGSNPVRM